MFSILMTSLTDKPLIFAMRSLTQIVVSPFKGLIAEAIICQRLGAKAG